jgi:hypothetical protein
MNGCGSENQSSGLTRSSPVHDRSDPDWNQRTVIVEQTVQHSPSRNSDLAVALSQRFDLSSPLPFNATMEAR